MCRGVQPDRSTAHNFHLIGTDISRQTPVPKTVRTTWRVRLREGTYRIQCDPDPVSMRIDLTVTSRNRWLGICLAPRCRVRHVSVMSAPSAGCSVRGRDTLDRRTLR